MGVPMILQGERVSLRALARADLDQVEAWTPYTDPLYVAWNEFPWHRMGKDLWYALESIDPAVERFAIVDRQARVIGLAALVSVDGGPCPVLSIFLGSAYVNQGLGSDAVRTLLGYAFQERKCTAVRLEVAATNARARRAYDKCGFRIVGSRYRPASDDRSLDCLDDERYRHLRRFCRQENGRTCVLFYVMEIRVRDWRPPGSLAAAQPGTAPCVE